MKKILFELGRYAATGGISSALYFIVSIWGNKIGLSDWFATFVGWAAAFCVSFFGHIRFTFRVDPHYVRMLTRYVANALFNLCYAEGITYWQVTWLKQEYWKAPLLIVITLPVISYTLGKFWVFKPKTVDP